MTPWPTTFILIFDSMKQTTNILETSHGWPLASIHSWLYIILKKTKLTYVCSHEAVHAEAPLWWRDANNGFKVAAPQCGSLILCEDDNWFCWFSGRECVPMTKWSTHAWRWREVVDGVLVLQFWWCALGWWLFCCIFISKKFWLLSRKKKLWTSTTLEILIVILKNGERTTLCVCDLFSKKSSQYFEFLIHVYPSLD